jgi:hypothetical protein
MDTESTIGGRAIPWNKHLRDLYHVHIQMVSTSCTSAQTTRRSDAEIHFPSLRPCLD